jgi:Bifunctional DNA primase/polymerase, N-terminal/Primase C terminal 1 (PriCT-1)
MLSSALKLASSGMSVFPCRVRDKRPATANGCNDASRDPDQIRSWWAQDENFNIGIATGDKSGIFVLDVDNDDGFTALAKFGVVPETVEAVTGKGEHFYFRMPAFDLRNSARKLGPGLDIRANGGYVLAPPSVHPSGKRYCWSVDSGSTFADAPQWLLDRLTVPAQRGAPPDWCHFIENGIEEGRRDVTLTSFAGYLFRHLIDPGVVRKILHLVNASECVPPLPDADVDRIFISIGSREQKRRAR